MKHLKLKLAVTALLASSVFSVYAADTTSKNSFSDVTPDDWAYKSVEKLSKEGVVDGYPDGSFKGDRNLTRYEMGQITGRLMAKEDTLNKQQKEEVTKLAGEYVDQLNHLGVRVSELEKKPFADTTFLFELREHYMPVYDNIYKDSKEKHDQFGTRFRINTYTKMNDRIWLYNQEQVLMNMGHGTYTDNNTTADDDSKIRLNRLYTTYHFGDLKDHYRYGKGPTDNNFVLGRFGMKMGLTGYTYDGSFTGALVQFGDHFEGGRFTIGYGRANDINYNYTGPMMRGMKNVKLAAAKLAGELAAANGAPASLSPVISNAINRTTNINDLESNITNDTIAATKASSVAKLMADRPGISKAQATAYVENSAEYKAAVAQLTGLSKTLVNEFQTSERLQALSNGLDWESGTYYPMLSEDVKMADGADEDVPVTFVSYIYKNPKKYDIHLYGLKANGPVGKIAKAYGAALGFNINNNLAVYGEYVKNMRKLPLNNERPYSLTLGMRYGEADVLKPHSYSISLDHVFSEAGTYFGGGSSDVADQYMAHVYKDWKFNGVDMGKTPAYIADKMDAVANGTDNANRNYGGAKFYLAKFQYVPIKGLRLQAEYGFDAKDMGGRKMDNMVRIEASAFFM